MKLVCDVCGFEFERNDPDGVKTLVSHVKEHIHLVRFDDAFEDAIHVGVKLDVDFLKDRSVRDTGKGVLVVLAGPPGCGKSTLAEVLHDEFGFQTVSSDAIRKELYGDESVQKDNSRVFETAHERARDLLNYCNVTFDATSCMRIHRKAILDVTAPSRQYAICAVFQDSLADCMNRNARRERTVPSDVVENMWWALRRKGKEPSVHEGFDEVVDAADLVDRLLAIFSSSK